MPRTSKRIKMELILRAQSKRIDSSAVNACFISKYHTEIITTLQMLDNVGDMISFEVDDGFIFIDDFKEYIESKKVKDVTFNHFGIYSEGTMLTVRLAKHLIKIN